MTTCSWCSAPLPEKPVEVLQRVRNGGTVVAARFCSKLCRDKSDAMIEGHDEIERLYEEAEEEEDDA
jgi:hypothetical protein